MSLSVSDDQQEAVGVIREPCEVARRTLALFTAVAAAFGADRDELIAWLNENRLRDALTNAEVAFLATSDPPERDVINFSWQSERLAVLVWALGLADFPASDDQCDTSIFQEVLPPYADVGPAQFIASALLLSDDELQEGADTLYELHWEARDAKLNSREPDRPVNLGVAQEQHHAINWIMGYEGLEWDEVTTDT